MLLLLLDIEITALDYTRVREEKFYSRRDAASCEPLCRVPIPFPYFPTCFVFSRRVALVESSASRLALAYTCTLMLFHQ
jgi:hypothetical protein